MSDELIDFIEKNAVSDEFYPLDKGLFTYHQITVNPVIAVEVWLSGEDGPFFKGVGSSKCNPNFDRFSFVRGTSIALRRAAKDFISVWGRERTEKLVLALKELEVERERLDRMLSVAEEEDILENPMTPTDWQELEDYIRHGYNTSWSLPGQSDHAKEVSEYQVDWVTREKVNGVAKEPSSDDKRSKLDVPTAFHVR